MIRPLQITHTKAQTAAIVHLHIPRTRAQQEIPVAIREVLAAISAQSLKTNGPLFTHHLKLSADNFDLEVGFPVSTPITSARRVKPSESPAATVVRTIYHGGYEGLFTAWSEFGKRADAELAERMKKEGLSPGETLWEVYVKGPESDPDPSTWRTELNRPLIPRGV